MDGLTRSSIRLSRGDTAYVVGIVSGAHFLSHVYLLAYPPLFPLIGAEFDLTTTQLGLLVTAIYLPTLVLQLPLGELVDRIGAKRILAAGLVVTSLGVSLSGLATSYWTLLALAFVSGIGQSVFHPADYALLESVTDSTNQGSAFGLHTFGGFAGFAAAPIVTGTIGVRVGWQAALLVVGSLGFVYAAIVLLTTESVYRRQIRDSSPDAGVAVSGAAADVKKTVTDLLGLFRSELLVVFSFYLVSMMAIVAFQSFTTVFAVESLEFAESTANNVLTAYLVGTAVGVVAGGPLADRVPFQPVIVASFTVAAVGVWFAVGMASDAGFVLAASIFGVVGLATGLALPARDKLANSFAAAGSTGKSFGFFFTGLSLGAVISPVLIGAIIDARSVVAALLVAGGFLVVAASIVVAVRLLELPRTNAG
ncbi:MFS transporter [Natronobacterium texcoconense]|uniref:Sugar phosphate permease n=1 Tax=Natronobacterium texcoconense TaxID=1095778 RepID=A0A1H0ZJI9_NATTX|nr:MFS transporter [Natronobacterium texcoconense]SDQ27620.1 Sugar phosphate permease [Natronobacterium texcoconense]